MSNSSATLSLALNLIMSYELSFEQKASFKKALVKNNPLSSSYEWNDVKSHMLLNQLFYDTSLLRITSWQVRVVIHELRHLAGSNETVYCLVEIGDQKFKTKEKHIDSLSFENDNQVFIL